MSLETYQKLDAKALNLNLPALQAGDLTVESCHAQFNDLASIIDGIKPNAGWQMYKDSTEVSPTAPTLPSLIEAQYSNGYDSIHIKLIAGGYIVTTYRADSTPNETYVFKAQTLRLSNKVKPIREALYHIWYQQVEGKWSPKCQQFIGFIKEAQ
jgi:hypothetical protein